MTAISDIFGFEPERKPIQRPLVEAQIAEMLHVFYHYGKPRFRPGDVVCARRAGAEPLVICEALDAPLRWENGARPDVRVMLVDDDGDVIARWCESWILIPWSERRQPIHEPTAETRQ